jgi:hypothetical protein
MNVEDLKQLINGEKVYIFDGKGSIELINNKFLTKINLDGKSEILDSYFNLDHAIKKIYEKAI